MRVDPRRCLVVAGAAGDHERAAGSQDAGDVGDGGGWVGHEVDGVGGDRGVGAVVGEGDGDAVAVSQGGAAVAAGGTVACRGLLDHRGRWVDAEHTVAGSHQDGGGAALAEADVEDRSGLGEVEFGEGAVVGVGGVLDHQASDDAAQQPARVPGLTGSETPDEPGPGGLGGGGHRGTAGDEVADHRAAGGGGVVGVGAWCAVPGHLDGPGGDDLDDGAGEDRPVDVGADGRGAQLEVAGPQVDERVAAFAEPDVGELGDLAGAAVEHHDRGSSGVHHAVQVDGHALDLVADGGTAAGTATLGDDRGELQGGDRGGQIIGDRRRQCTEVGWSCELRRSWMIWVVGPGDHFGEEGVLRVDAAVDRALRHAEPFRHVVHLRAVETVLDERRSGGVEQLGTAVGRRHAWHDPDNN